MKRKTLLYPVLGLFVAAIIALDRWTKQLIRAADEAGKLPTESFFGIFHLTHAENTGGAWSLFEGQLWLFILVMVLFVAILAVLIWKKIVEKPAELTCLAAILGGGLGNMIDRLAYGSVTDMICFDFVDFPVFNVADMFITCACAALIVVVLLDDRKKSAKATPDAEETEENQ